MSDVLFPHMMELPFYLKFVAYDQATDNENATDISQKGNFLSEGEICHHHRDERLHIYIIICRYRTESPRGIIPYHVGKERAGDNEEKETENIAGAAEKHP